MAHCFLHRVLLIAGLLLALSKNTAAVWPQPQVMSAGSTPLRLSSRFSIKVAIRNAPKDLQDAVTRTQGFLKNDKLQILVPDRGKSLSGSVKSARELETLTLSLTGNRPIRSISEEAVIDFTKREESYNLHVPSSGSASLTANSTLGLLRGLTTFSQLWYYLNGETYTMESPISIEDYPSYPYRGFMLDTARNYFPPSAIQKTLDSLSATKINTFHWHIVDSQSFPLQLNDFPELVQAAYDSSSVYTESDIQDIVSYAAARGIDVMLEIDTPGHTASIATSHPEYIACNDLQPWSTYANEPPAGQLRLTEPNVIKFISSLFSSAAKLSPSTLFSTGGDEINMNCYDQDGPTQQGLKTNKQTFEEALSNFTQKTHSALEKQGKTPVVWEEMVLDHNVTLSNNTIALVWISSQNAAAVAAKGYRLIHAASDYFYLDCGAGGWVGDNVEGNSWCEPFKTWQKAYSFDPLANISESQKHLVVGGEQLLWTEQSGPQNYESMIWPRAAASAEVFWTGGSLNGTEALTRLHNFRYRLVQRGVNAINLQPEWCALRPHACDLLITSASSPTEAGIDRGMHKDRERRPSEALRGEQSGTSHYESDHLKEPQDVPEPFSIFLQNHIQKTLHNFFGFNPFITRTTSPGADDSSDVKLELEVVSDKSAPPRRNHRELVEEEELQRPMERQRQSCDIDDELRVVAPESFSTFLRNHIQKTMHNFFGFDPYISPTDATDDELIVHEVTSEEEDPQKPTRSQSSIHDDSKSESEDFDAKSHEQRKAESTFTGTEEESFRDFFQKHVRKRMTDYFGGGGGERPAVIVPRQRHGAMNEL